MQAEAKRKRINELKHTEEGKKLLEQDAWESMMKRAKREKVLHTSRDHYSIRTLSHITKQRTIISFGQVRDDLTLLKKTQKRKQASKRRSKRAWQERTEEQQKKMKAKADKRKSNILNRGKPKPQPATEQRRAGFEGRKTDFLNKKNQKPKKWTTILYIQFNNRYVDRKFPQIYKWLSTQCKCLLLSE